VLAPTDPVLATAVAVPDAKDKDRLRYALSGEAGLNDGTAFPFVVLALLWIEQGGGWGPWVGEWALERLLWAVPAGLGLGFALGFGLGRLAIRARQHTRDPATSSDLLLLALIALSYALAEFAQAWGFLAVFAAGVGLRRAEVRTVRDHPVPRSLSEPAPPLHPEETPAEALLEREVSAEALAHPTIATGAVVRDVLSFGEVLERLMALVSVVLTGVLVSLAWDWRGVALAAMLFCLIRPLAVAICLSRTPTTRLQRGLIAWFGIRGVGSLYYLTYAVGEGLGRGRAEDVSGIALTVVALSVLLHGSSVTPLLGYYERSLERAER
jgi:NhaP-type Na+/H+ or K+/H+ antiporter